VSRSIAAPGAGADDPDADATEPHADFERRAGSVAPGLHGERLDKVLVALAPEFSRSHLQGLAQAGHVRLDGHVATTVSRRVKAGQAIELELVPTDESRAFRAQPMALDVVHEDEHLLVIHKPAGLVVHPAPGHWSGTLLNGLLARDAGAAALPRAGIVHRLDKDTSGLMVVARTLPAMTALVRALAERRVSRRYVAIAHGEVAAASIEAPIGRDPASRLRMAVVRGGKPSRTDVAPAGRRPGAPAAFTPLHCTLHTGRTHQIRVHLASRGHPLVADALYGGAPALGLTRQALHAVRLAFEHPGDGRAMAFAVPPPADLAAAWDSLTHTPP
jgi:23S rRNA pseudouridine1911/1915/1917 synthase